MIVGPETQPTKSPVIYVKRKAKLEFILEKAKTYSIEPNNIVIVSEKETKIVFYTGI